MVPGSETADGLAAVTSPPETHQLCEAFRERGFAELSELGLPFAVTCAAGATLASAFTSNPFGYFALTRCAADLLEAHGTEDLKTAYLERMRRAEYMGTMALSESHAGSSLSNIRTVATPSDTAPRAAVENGSEVRIRGDKMWTTGAFHDVADNIVHMLLARLDGAPEGAITLCLVPNVLPDGTKNDVELVSLNRKMGHKAVTNCAWTLGERSGGAVGWIVGQPNKGLHAMFGMMNAMRIEVGLGAAVVGKRAYQESLLYAQERFQGGRPIVEYDDVRRMLLLQKASAEGSYALCIHAACLHDQATLHRDTEAGTEAGKLLDSITEVVKSWPSEWCLEGTKLAIQVAGGAGYVRDYAFEQLYRDQRLNMIHEGTAGIHAITLLGRKVQKGKAQPLFHAMHRAIAEAEAEAKLAISIGGGGQKTGGATAAVDAASVLRECAAGLREAIERAEHVTSVLTGPTVDKAVALTNAHDYLTMMGHTCIAWTWLRMATAAAKQSRTLGAIDAEADASAMFYAGKLQTASFFFRHELPRTKAHAELLLSLDSTVRTMRPGWF